ncbi:hypothetical protein J4464_01350 [Candidatus Woesearchaeota archaeon]|nr:hypothetical protein [Candidatus Woesearchaeota archaeon]
MEYHYQDREGQIAEIYGIMVAASMNLQSAASFGYPLETPAQKLHDDLVAKIELVRPEVARLDHPILTDTFETLEELAKAIQMPVAPG